MVGFTRDRTGFSLPELLIVLGLFGILASYFAPRLDVAKFRQDSAVLEISMALGLAQQKAVLRGHSVRVGIDTAGARLVLHEDANNDQTVDTGEDVRVVELGDGVSFGLGGAPTLHGTAFAVAEGPDGVPTLRFFRNGAASQEGTIYLTSERAASSGAFPEDARALTLERSTGRTTCHSYRSGAWVATC